MKICNTCQKEKPFSEFHSTGYDTRVDGSRVKNYKPNCKVCANIKWKQQITERLEVIVSEWACCKCGYNKCREALDFHHRDPTKKDFTIASRWCISEQKLRKEIAKCVLLCSNCHRELHAGLWNLTDLGH